MFTYFTTPFQCNYSRHNAKTFCTFFFLSFAILRRVTHPTRAWAFQGSDFPPKLCFDFLRYLSPPTEGKHDFYFFFSPAWICVKRLPPGVAARPGAARGCVGRRNHKRFFSDFQDSEPVSLNHTTYPAVIPCFRVLVHFPLCLYQPIPTEF